MTSNRDTFDAPSPENAGRGRGRKRKARNSFRTDDDNRPSRPKKQRKRYLSPKELAPEQFESVEWEEDRVVEFVPEQSGEEGDPADLYNQPDESPDQRQRTQKRRRRSTAESRGETVDVSLLEILQVLDQNIEGPVISDNRLLGLYHYVRQRECPYYEKVSDVQLLKKLCRSLAREVSSFKHISCIADEQEEVGSAQSEFEAMPTSTVDNFLTEINNLIRDRNGAQLQDYLIIEPPYQNLYDRMVGEVRNAFPKGREDALEAKCSAALPYAREGVDGASWTAFIKFIVQYFGFLRDVNIDNLLDTYNLLAEVVQKCNSALSHPSLGAVILPTVISYARILASFAIGLDKKPELIVHLTQQSSDDGGSPETLPERAANIVRQAFVTCLNDRTGPPVSSLQRSRPEGKKGGIYTLANICLKILFQCKKERNAEQIFTNIYNQSPPLSLYPRSEQVTYLYYLGRFQFNNSHFYRAQLALQAAFDGCRRDDLRQRRLILIYLITSNIFLGRFPSDNSYGLPEAIGLQERFQPLCKAIAKGDLCKFYLLVSSKNQHYAWFLHMRIILQIRSRGEVLVWRSLVRRTFLQTGDQGDVNSRRAPTLDLKYLLHVFRYLTTRSENPISQLDHGPGKRHPSFIFMDPPQPKDKYVDPDFEGTSDGEPDDLLPDMRGIEGIVSSLITQGLLNGYLSHSRSKFAIQGAKKKGGPLKAGFPNVWEVISARYNDEVPGWKKDDASAFSSAFPRPEANTVGPGSVINLSGARPVGSGL